MFTLRIILYGLIALVDGNRPEGVLALLVSDPNHQASVWMMEGECVQQDGQTTPCHRFPGSPAQADMLSQIYQQAGFNLTWFLQQEHVSLDLSQAEAWDQPQPIFFGTSTPVFPEDAAQTRSLIWVPELTRIVPGADGLRPDCLGAPAGCPVAARFEMSRGLVSSCHLVHEGDGEAAEVHAFDFRPDGASVPTVDTPQSISDAVMIEIKINAPSVELRSRQFTSDQNQQAISLIPQQGRVTLIVSNNDYSGQGSHNHFAHYYQLLQNAASLTNQPLPYPRSKQQLSPGACETILDAFETALGVADIDGVHNHRQCDMTQISGS